MAESEYRKSNISDLIQAFEKKDLIRPPPIGPKPSTPEPKRSIIAEEPPNLSTNNNENEEKQERKGFRYISPSDIAVFKKPSMPISRRRTERQGTTTDFQEGRRDNDQPDDDAESPNIEIVSPCGPSDGDCGANVSRKVPKTERKITNGEKAKSWAPTSSLLRPLPPLPHKQRYETVTMSLVSTEGSGSVRSLSEDESETEPLDANAKRKTFSEQPTTSSLTPAEKAKRVAEEFYTTEVNYVRTLEALNKHFPDYMNDQSKMLNRPLVEPDVPEIIARSVDELIAFHRTLAAEFKARLDSWETEPRLADILTKHGPFLKMSVRFLRRKDELANEVLNACKRHPDFAAALLAFEKQYFEGLHLVHNLDSVHQHLCRYPLLLSSYLKYLPPDSPEYESAKAAKQFIDTITLDLEKSLAQEDGARKLNELYRRIVNSSFEVIRPGRKLIKEGPILKYSRKELQPRHLILFSDVLLCCAPVVTGSAMLRIRYIFYLNDEATNLTQTDDTKIGADVPGWEFVVNGRQKSIRFICASVHEGKSWEKAIQKTIAQFQQRRGSDVLPRSSVYSGDSSTITDTDSGMLSPAYGAGSASNLGKMAPAWTPDKRVTMCQCCSANFTALRRRHHCRACGRVICGQCSGQAPLEYDGYRPNRVCPYCYPVLINNAKEEQGDGPRMPLSPFVAPKNGFRMDLIPNLEPPGAGDAIPSNDDEQDDQVIMEGYTRVSKNGRQQWKRYWGVIRAIGLMEFYKAMNDSTCEFKIVLVGWHVRSMDEDSCTFELAHRNQFQASADRQEISIGAQSGMCYWMKADDYSSMSRWLEALEQIMEKFS